MSLNTAKKQLRQEKILWSLSKMGFATREHLQGAHDLGTDRNALKVLRELKDYVHVRNHVGRNIYYLSKKGCDLIGVEDSLSWTLQADHYLLRNDMYVYFKCPDDWRTEKKITLKPAIGQERTLVPDAMFTQNDIYHFLEVDRTQSMVENRKKIDYYSQVNLLIKSQFQSYPTLLFYTTTPSRKETLANLCKEKGLTFRIYTKEDL